MAKIAAAALTGSEAEFEAGPYTAGELAVLEFEHEAEISRLFTLDLTLVAMNDAEIDASSLIGEKALLTIQHGDGSARFVSGVVCKVKRWEDGTGPYRKRFRIRVVPKLWTLGKIHRSRIFQQMSVVEIVEKILKDAAISLRKSTSANYLKRDYCVQYRETDLEFVFRLLEEEGIFCWFEHEQGKHTLVLGDTSLAYGAISGQRQVSFKQKSKQIASADFIDQFSACMELRPGKVALRDYNPLFPAVDMNANHSTQDGDTGLEEYEYPGNYLNAAAGKAVAKIRLEEARVKASVCSGSGISRRLVPGCVFELVEHPIDDLDGEYLVLSVDERGEQPEVLGTGGAHQEKQESYRSRFSCLAKDIPYRPERRAKRPIIPGAQTALVVGPSGEEIHTDAHGRIKVQFHWDREGKKDEKSSCWIRVSQSWAGVGWGALYLPRIGQEVVVEFLEGDPDRPLVTGSVYNGQNPVPIQLPSDKTKSTLRSASSPGSNGSNELRFEDAAGLEEIYFHAQKDWNIVIENDKAQTIGGNEHLKVKKDRSREIEGNQSLHVVKNDTSTIDQNQTLLVKQNRSTTVSGNHTEKVAGDQSITVDRTETITVGLAATETIGAAKTVTIGAAYAVNVGAAMTEAVAGVKSEEIGGAKVEVIGGKKTERVGGSRSLKVGEDMSEEVGKSKTLKIGKDLIVNVEGNLRQQVAKEYKIKAKEITLSAEQAFTLQVGSAKIQLKKNGDIVVKGSKVEVNSSGDVIIKGSKVEEN
jgi:type VI secretion system secreted protein VgrG